MAAHEMKLLDQQRLAQGQLDVWQFLAECALWSKTVIASVQRMAKRIEDLEAERDKRGSGTRSTGSAAGRPGRRRE